MKAKNGAGLGIGDVRNLEDVERTHILRVLELCENQKTKAAAMLGIKYDALRQRLTRARAQLAERLAMVETLEVPA